MRIENYGTLILSNSNRNCQSAAGKPYKFEKLNKGKLGQKTSHIARSERTHTTLRCCADGKLADPQKSKVYGPRPISKCLDKALSYHRMLYAGFIEMLYFNGLGYRLISSRFVRRAA